MNESGLPELRSVRPPTSTGGGSLFSSIVTVLTSGLLVGLLEVILAISFGALIFAGPLAPFVGPGIGMALAGAILVGLIVGSGSSVTGTVAGNQDVPAAIIAVTAAAIVAAMPAVADARDAFVTVVVAVALMTALSGLFFYTLGHLRLGALVRYLPYPVIGGFLAGAGWLLMVGAVGLMVDTVPTLSALPSLLLPEQLVRWLPGAMLAIVILVVLDRVAHPLALPGLIVGGIALFYAVAAATDRTVTDLSAAGWLLGPFPQGSLWPPLSLSDFERVHWPALPGQVVNLLTLWLLSTVALLLNVSGWELTANREMELNQELKVAGAANFIASLSGGLVGYHQLSLSAMNQKLSGGRRASVFIAVGVCAAVLFLGGTLLSLFPKAVVGGLLFFLGLSFLVEWAVAAAFSLPRGDYFVVLLILLITAFVGFLEAVGVGLLVAVAFFVVNYSRIDVVRDEFSGAQFQSRVNWRPAQRNLLHAYGEKIQIVRLQGYIFFGTADRLYDHVRRKVEAAPPAYLILDFRRVTGVDTTALSSFKRIYRLVALEGVALVLTGLPPAVRRQLEESAANEVGAQVFSDLDRGCEWCERQLVAALAPERTSDEQDPLHQELARVLDDADLVERLLSYFDRRELAMGDYLMREGDEPDSLYLIEAGRVTVQTESEDVSKIRLQTMEGGNILGELGFFLGTERTASVIADTECVVHHLSRDAMEHMEWNDREVATAFHRLVIRLLAERVVYITTALRAVQR